MPFPLLFTGSAPLSSCGLTLNVLSKKSPSWVSLSKQGLPVSLSPSTVLISFLVLSAVCSHFTLLLTCLLCREGCSLHLPGQPSLFPAGLAGVPGFMRGRLSVAISDPVNQEFEQGGVLGPPVFLRPSTLVWTVPRLPKQLWPWFAKAVYTGEGEGSWEKLKLLRVQGSRCHAWRGPGPAPKVWPGGDPPYLSPGILRESLSLCLTQSYLSPEDPKDKVHMTSSPVDWWVNTCLPCPSYSPLVLCEKDLCLAWLSLPCSHSVSHLIHRTAWSPWSFLKLSCSAS